MRLVRFGDVGNERPGLLLDHSILDVTELTGDFDPAFFASDGPAALAARSSRANQRLPTHELDAVRLGPPVASPGKIVCIGLNYHEHAREAGQPVPAEPVVFMKAPNTLVGPNDEVLIPVGSEKTDWEIELAVVIGTRCRYLPGPSLGRASVAGFAISNDVSERHFQLERGGQWDKGKSCESFNPFGPHLVSPDEVGDPHSLSMELSVNGEVMQRSNTADMVFDVGHIVWYLSQFMVLEPGDIVNTGTPAGVGLGRDPPRYLEDGDVMELTIEQLGSQQQHCRQAQP